MTTITIKNINDEYINDNVRLNTTIEIKENATSIEYMKAIITAMKIEGYGISSIIKALEETTEDLKLSLELDYKYSNKENTN